MTEVRFPTERAQAIWGERRAGGTDVMDRLHHGRIPGPIVDLRDLSGLDRITGTPGGGLQLGARLTLGEVAADPAVRAGWPGFAEAVGGLGTPQIRTVATLGGNLLQRTRCAWFRSPDFRCFKAGGAGCPAAAVDHPWNAPLAEGVCVAPHPSTVGLALLAFDASVELVPRGRVDVPTLYGDGMAPGREHTVGDEELLVAVNLPAPLPGARSGWFRVASRARAEWPLVEVVVHLAPGLVRVVAGGVAPVPIRLPGVEAALLAGTSVEAAVATIPVPASAAPSARSKLAQLGRAVAIVVERLGGVGGRG